MLKLLPLILKNIRRNRRRTFLTVASIGISLFLFTALLNALATMDRFNARADRSLRVAVHHKISLAVPLPIAYGQKIAKVPGIVAICPFQWYGGLYRNSKELIHCLAVDVDTMLDVWGDAFELDGELWNEFLKERTGAIVGSVLARKHGWKKGEKVTLKGTVFPVDLEFKVVGTPVKEFDPNCLVIQRKYLEELLGNPGIATDFWCKVERADQIPAVIETVDKMFENSPWETITQTEKAFMANFVDMFGNIRGMVGGIGMIVVLTIILVAANSIAMSVRERTTEIAVLKAIGFKPWHVLFLILGESMLISLLGGYLGCLTAYTLFTSPTLAAAMGPIGSLFIAQPSVFAKGIGVGLAIGALAGLVPAVVAARSGIVDALRKVA